MLRRDFCQVAGAATGWLLFGGMQQLANARPVPKDNYLQIATDTTFGPGVLVLEINGGVLTKHYTTPLSDGQTYFWRQTVLINGQHVQVYHGRLEDQQLQELLDLYDDELMPFIETVSKQKPPKNDDDQGDDNNNQGKRGEGLIPDRYDLGRNYPNPFSDRTTIPIALPADGHVQLTVYDSTGRLVATVVNETMQAGAHRLDWRPSGLPSGTYLMILKVNGVSRTQNVTLVR